MPVPEKRIFVTKTYFILRGVIFCQPLFILPLNFKAYLRVCVQPAVGC